MLVRNGSVFDADGRRHFYSDEIELGICKLLAYWRISPVDFALLKAKPAPGGFWLCATEGSYWYLGKTDPPQRLRESRNFAMENEINHRKRDK
jgi:hypothetical protein